MVQLLLSARADMEVQDHVGMTALMRSSRAGHLQVVRALLGAGCDKNLCDHGGLTAVLHACQTGHVEVKSLLV